MMEEEKRNHSSIGGLVGKMNGGKIENSHAEGKIIITGEAKNVGGLVGDMSEGEIIDSTSNMEIIQNSESLFTELKSVLEQIKEVDRKNELLNLVGKMESSKGTTSFKEHYKNFISSSADYVTLIYPFLSKFTDFF